MKKYFGLSNREETTLRYSTSAGQWIDTFLLLALNAVLINGAVAHTKNNSFVDSIWRIFCTSEKVDDKAIYKPSGYSKGFIWSFVALTLIRTSLYFVNRYLESKVVSDYESTDEIERS